METAAETRRRLRILLPLAIFVVVIDSTIMNVSIGALVDDLDTEIAGVQSAIALYALVMASFLLTGAKLGDILGRRRAFSLGLGLYGVGSAGTAVSQNLTMLILFWSVIEGLGAAVLFPTVQALVRTHFEGGDRMKLYALIGSVVGAGAAVGPLVGGFFTTVLTWRLAFAVEVVVVLVVLAQVRHIPVRTTPQPWREFDLVGSLLSVLGLGGVIVGILSGSRPGESVAWPLVGAGVGFLALLAWWIAGRERRDRVPLVRSALARNAAFRSGVTQSLVQQFVVGGSMLITPIYVQMVLEYSALQSGLVVMPLSLSMFVTSNSVPRLRSRFSSRPLLQFGMVMMIAGIAWLIIVLDPGTGALTLVPGLLLMGVGLGFQMSQLNNLILSSVPVEQASEAGGVNTTAGQFGISLGTAMAGTVMLFGLTSGFADLTADSTVLSDAERDAVAEALERDARIISNTELEALLEENRAEPELQAEIIRINTEARPQALRLALLAPLVAGFLGLFTSTRLPRNPATDVPVPEVAPDERTDRSMIPTPVRVQPAFADPDAVLALIRASGPYWPLARYARSAEEQAASGGGSGGGSFVPPWFRQDVAVGGVERFDGAGVLLDNPAFVEAAHRVFDRDRIVRPTTVYVNLMTPCPYPFIAHVDVPAFRGVTRDRYPVWLLHQMKVSGLFEPWRIRLATAVSWFFDGPGGAFHYWPDGPEGAGEVIEPPFENIAVVADNERVYHGVGPLVPPGRAELTDLSIDAELRRRSADDGWDVMDRGGHRASYDDADVRVAVSWKAEVFRDEEEQRIVDEHLDDLTIERVLAAFADDLSERAVAVAPSDDPLHDPAWIEALAATYAERPPRIA